MVSRCPICKKKIGIMAFTCPYCHIGHCTHHRLPEDHFCQSDYKKKDSECKIEKLEDTKNYTKM